MDYSFIYDEFLLMFPRIADHAVSWEQSSEMEIRIILDDGDEMRYDFLDKTLRRVKYHDDDDLEEQIWRKEFARNLSRRMMYKNISQETLSDLTGISRRTISKYLNCNATPSTYNTRRLAKALDCDYNDLIRVS